VEKFTRPSFLENMQIMKILSLIWLGWCFSLLFVLGCDGEKPNTSEVTTHEDRFADFNDVVKIEWGHSGGNYNNKWKTKVTIIFTPTRTGAYLLESTNKSYKHISPAMDPTTQPTDPVFEFDYSTSSVNVTYSDGKSIERTVIKTD
jgi:hypothetical protein